MKTLVGWLCAAVATAALGWVGTYLYWHVRIVGAIRTLETQAGGAGGGEGEGVLLDAGCRALPYLVASLEPRKNPYFLKVASVQISSLAFSRAAAGGNSELPAEDWSITLDDSAAERARKCDAIQQWWLQNGARYHRTWRVWSSNCAR